MAIRLAMAGFQHESNTFSSQTTGPEDFVDSIHRGDEIRDVFADSTSMVTGFLEADEVPSVDVDPLLLANAGTSGKLTRNAFIPLLEETESLLSSRGPWDGVLLAQHGAAVAEGLPDLDGTFIEMVRRTVGTDIPIGVCLDMHANVSTWQIDNADILVAYQTNPHVDARERARHCADLLIATARADIQPTLAFVGVPLALHIAVQGTSHPPMSTLLNLVRDIEEAQGLLSVSLIEGFPYADVPQMGMSIVTIADGDREVALSSAEEIARAVWQIRGQLTTTLPSSIEALDDAASTAAPTLVLDVGDNTGGGAPADSTILLHHARSAHIRGVFQTLADPEAVTLCQQEGIGGQVDINVGGRHPDSPAPPFAVSGEVVALSSGRFEDPTPTHGGYRHFDSGPTAVVETDDGFTLMLTTKRLMNTSLRQMTHAGLDPASFSVLIAKGVNSPKAGYQSAVDRMIYADTPGIAAANLSTLGYRNRQRCFPFENWDWTPKAHLGARSEVSRKQ